MRPMLAATLKDLSVLRYPVYCTPKLDGIRCLVINGIAYTRNMKKIPNKHISKMIADSIRIDIDGELIVGNTFQSTSSAVMSVEGELDFKYKVFDHLSLKKEDKYIQRIRILANEMFPYFVDVLCPTEIKTKYDLLYYENYCLKQGNEGIIIRSNVAYKQGRSTVKEQGMFKLKRFIDSEAIVIGFVPRYHNANPKKKNEFGYSQRSSHKANMILLETLGALQVRDLKTSIEFEIGSGFTDKQRKLFWHTQTSLINKIVKYKYQSIGVLNKPRFPVFLGFRDSRDIGGKK